MYFKCCVCVVAVFVCVKYVAALEAYKNREELGYPVGLMSLCPGSLKPAKIPKSQMKHLFFQVQGKGRTRQKYTYWTAKSMAKDPRIDFKRKTMLLAIGYLDSSYFPISSMYSNMYEDRGYNVILLDNQRFASVHYHLSSRMMRPVGRHVAEVLAQLVEAGLDPGKLELLGFSLGGHTVSYIGKNFQQLTGRNISRITALEPSGPCFRTLGPEDRLSASDAEFVEVIHTNIDGFGMANTMGHVDFYINGGEYQPSEVSLYPCTSTCSHFRVLYYWQSALRNPGKFIGLKCDSIQQARDYNCYDREPLETNVMGLGVNKKKHGIFFVSTDKFYPYFLGENGLKKEFAAWRQVTNVNDSNETEIFT
ncbi:unnamed protein product [Plutella xylostella]|uniref:(diamondback moth) hypothetical protein n=1 Tax=Plutella xylostella TaxID=51655 RepID=A0A8S4FVN5_PLUXY|nr:unnamed protein product [Plutella xylostella]